MQRWVKMPTPGQYRGEGQWMKLDSIEVMACFAPGMPLDDIWHYLSESGWLPITTTEDGETPE